MIRPTISHPRTNIFSLRRAVKPQPAAASVFHTASVSALLHNEFLSGFVPEVNESCTSRLWRSAGLPPTSVRAGGRGALAEAMTGLAAPPSNRRPGELLQDGSSPARIARWDLQTFAAR